MTKEKRNKIKRKEEQQMKKENNTVAYDVCSSEDENKHDLEPGIWAVEVWLIRHSK